jgi:hypothetical protein
MSLASEWRSQKFRVPGAFALLGIPLLGILAIGEGNRRK